VSSLFDRIFGDIFRMEFHPCSHQDVPVPSPGSLSRFNGTASLYFHSQKTPYVLSRLSLADRFDIGRDPTRFLFFAQAGLR